MKQRIAIAATVLLMTASGILYGVPEWSVALVVDNTTTPLANDCRRPMSAGLYDPAVNKTFICFTGANMKPVVAAYDHGANAWSAPAGITIPDSSTDNHDYPHIFQSADGYLHVTYSRHNVSLWIATSEKPHSIDGTWHVRQIGSNLAATYPMPAKGSDGSLYIFYRVSLSPTDYRPIKWVRSTDNGTTWSSPQSCIDYSNSRIDFMNEIYLGQMNYEPDHPQFGEGYSASWTLAGGGGTTHVHDRYHKNMYYAFFTISNAHWRAASGADLGTNIDDSEAEAHCLVYDSGKLVGNLDLGQVPDIGYTSSSVCQSNGYPMVAFQNGKSNSVDIGRWTGTEWVIDRPATFQGTSAMFDFNRVDNKLWLLMNDGNGAQVVDHSDGAWTNVAAYHPDLNAGDNIFIDNPRPEVLVFSALDTRRIYTAGHPDETPPIIINAASIDSTTVKLIFDEEIGLKSATNTANYSIANGNSVLSASRSAYNTVVLTITEMMPHLTYTVSVDNVTNQTGLAIAANSEASFVYTPPPPPEITADGASCLTAMGKAVLNGTLTTEYSADVYVFWDVIDQGTNMWAWNAGGLSTNQSSGTFSTLAIGLTSAVGYTYRCFASNQYGCAWSSPSTFIMPAVDYTLIEDFESRTLNIAITGQGNWGGDTTSASEYSVRTDPDDPSNQVLYFNQGVDKEVYNNSAALRITNNTTSTLFFRMRGFCAEAGSADLWLMITMSDASTSSAFTDGETDMTLNDDGAGSLTFTGGHMLTQTNWYRVWVVVDNAADNFDIYMQREGNNNQFLAASGRAFRNGTAANDLVSFMLKVNSNSGLGSNGDAWFDDIYVAHGLDAHAYSPVGPDKDMDALDDSWEITHFGGLSSSDGSSTCDQDNDGFIDLHEYLAGTDPANRNDVFNLHITYSNGLPVVSFESRTTTSNYYGALRRYYTLEYLTDLTLTNWTVMSGYSNIPASGLLITYTSNSATNLFYRAKAWLE